MEWTGIWAALLNVVLAVGAGGSWVIARLQLEPAVAAQLSDAQGAGFLRPCGNRCSVCSVLGRKLRNQNLGMAILGFLEVFEGLEGSG